MIEPPVRHTHADGTTHAHTTTLWPAAVELLQLFEDFAAGLPPEAEEALRRLLRAGLLVETPRRPDAGGEADTAGYQHDWYRAYLATHHEHPPGAPTADGGTFHYRPWWWPPGPAHTRGARPPPAGARGGPERDTRSPRSPGTPPVGSKSLHPLDYRHITREEDLIMTTQPDPPEEARWLLEPPQPGQINISISVGDDVAATPEIREAVERLLSAIGMGDVTGYQLPGTCGPQSVSCPTFYNCNLDTCRPVVQYPNCLLFTSCKVASLR